VQPQVNSSTFAGTYTNAGYGNFTLCNPSSAHPVSACAPVLANFSAVAPTAATDLYAAWPRFWGSYLQLSPIANPAPGVIPSNASTYSVALLNLYPGGFGANTSPFAELVDNSMVAAFEVEKDGRVGGMGIFGVAEEVTLREKMFAGGSVSEIADAYFAPA
jgi:hypothetical protein